MKRKYIVFGGVLLVICLSIVFMYNKNYSKEVTREDDVKKIEPLSGLAIMLETKAGSGEYVVSESNTWPDKGYQFNSIRSGCENGGTLSYNEQTKKVTLKSNVSDKCYVYFDVVPHDIMITTSNLPASINYKLGNIICDNSNATYNQLYNRIEVSQVNGQYSSCTLNYTDSTSKANFADYVMSLAGTTQGTGEVVKETVNIPDYSSTTTLSQGDYTSYSMFSSSYAADSSGTVVSGVFTFANNKWTSVPSTMTSDTYYHFKFSPSENGYYQLCYELSSGNTNNELYAFVNSSLTYFDSSDFLSASSSTSKSGCLELGYVSTSDYINIVQKAYTDISTLSFSIKKVTSVQENVDAGTRYEGKNPNNYVWFNDEYWRIIGVFDSTSHGQNGKILVKMIRDEVLDGLAWSYNKNNIWSYSYLNSLLNQSYYNAEDGTNSGYCYGGLGKYSSFGNKGNCNYTKRGIQKKYREMIANVTWYLGTSSPAITAETIYNRERNISDSEENLTISAKIGLMYASDYGFSILSSSCARTVKMGSYASSQCAGQSWMYGNGYEWMITSDSSEKAFAINYYGFLTNIGVYYGGSVRPVLYMNESVFKISGDGSLENPYIIGM